MDILNFPKTEYKKEDNYLTGYFRDGKRRIDLILVSQDSEPDVELFKLNFLLNSMKTGIEFEIETGTHTPFKDLLFIKVHVPAHIIRHFGYMFNFRKYFKTGHVELIQPQIKDEKYYIKLMRKSYPGPINYSTMDRSMIAYRVLSLISFGDPPNYRGLPRAMNCGMFLDVFPLHDGPYFLVQGQPLQKLTGRQALFYTWIGYSNLFRYQPINLIREYYGERIGFVFMFYQFIMIYLLIVSLPGFIMMALNFVDLKKRYFLRPREYSLLVAPKCNDFVGCPIRQVKEYIRELEIKTWLDNPWILYHLFLFMVTAIAMTLVWRRKENYYHWLWELNEEEDRCSVRPDFNAYTAPKPEPVEPDYETSDLKVTKTGGKTVEKDIESKENAEERFKKMRDRLEWDRQADCLSRLNVPPGINEETREILDARIKESKEQKKGDEKRELKTTKIKNAGRKKELIPCWKIKELILTMLLICLLFLLNMVLLTFQYKFANKLRYFEEAVKDQKWFKAHVENPSWFYESIIREITFSINGVLIVLLEMGWERLAHWMTFLSNAYEEKLNEKILMTKLFGGSFLINFFMIFLIILFKGVLYIHPFEDRRYFVPFHLGMMNCGLQGCIDEAFLGAAITYKTRMLFRQVLDMINAKFYVNDVPDTDQCVSLPCWEREYQLKPFTDADIVNKFNEIFVQLAYATLFVWVFPIAPVVVFLVSLFQIRYWARDMLLYTRRPLITHTWGLGYWRTLLWLFPYLISIFNIYGYVRNTMLSRRLFDNKYFFSINAQKFFATNYGKFFAYKQPLAGPHSYWAIPSYDKTTDRSQALAEFLEVRTNFKGPWAQDILFPPRWIYNIPSEKWYPDVGSWYICWRQAQITLFVGFAVVASALLLHFFIEPNTFELREMLEVEKSCRDYEIKRQLIKET